MLQDEPDPLTVLAVITLVLRGNAGCMLCVLCRLQDVVIVFVLVLQFK